MAAMSGSWAAVLHGYRTGSWHRDHVDPVETLRSAAIRERLGRTVGSDQLIKAALDAVMAGVDSPALSEFAGLGRREEPEAHGLFDRVIDELELAPTLPTDPTAARWALVRWWCQLIVGGELAPEVAGRLIWFDGWIELGYPDALRPLVGWVSEWEDWRDDGGVPRGRFRAGIVREATLLIQRPWPPES